MSDRRADAPPEGLVRAQNVARAIVERLTPHIVEGVSEIELSLAATEIAAELGSEGFWTGPTTRVGLGTLVAHPEFPMQDRRARIGDTVVVDVNPTVDGWLGDYCVTVQVGESEEAARLIEQVHRLQQRIIRGIVPGMRACDLYAEAEALFRSEDLKNFDLLDNIGHSLGREFAAEGFIDADNDTPMWGAWTIEPQLGRRAAAAKFEDIVWLSPGRPPRTV